MGWWNTITIQTNGISSSNLCIWTKIWFSSDFHENLHMDAHYHTDYGYYENNVFFHHQGWWRCCFLLFKLLLSNSIDMAHNNGAYDDLITTETIDQIFSFRDFFFIQLTLKEPFSKIPQQKWLILTLFTHILRILFRHTGLQIGEFFEQVSCSGLGWVASYINLITFE